MRRRLAVVLEKQNVAKAAVVLQIEGALAKGPENFLDRTLTGMVARVS